MSQEEVTEKRVETFIALRDGTAPSGTGVDFNKIISAARKGGSKKSNNLKKWTGIWEQLLGASQLDVVGYAEADLEDTTDDNGNPVITKDNLQRVLRWLPMLTTDY